MKVLIGIIIISFITFIVITSIKNKKKRNKIEDLPTPINLGTQMDIMIPIIRKLDKTLTSSYASNVKYRFMQEHPKVEGYEFDWVFFELKRYFVMNRLLKSVPMFSPRVDDIWHEMLMFTREYEKFSKDFYGVVLHHTPNLEVSPIPGERGFFDWVYLSLFASSPNSRAIWGGFLKNPIGSTIMDDFQHLTDKELLSKYFRQSSDWYDVKLRLIHKLKNEIKQSEQLKATDTKPAPLSSSTSEAKLYHLAVSAAVFYSLYDTDKFQNNMIEVMPDEYYKTAAANTGSACSGFACSSSSDNDSGGGSGGDSGGSSCSSCGGGCSS